MANKYGVYLDAGGTTIRFPVNPEEITIEYPEQNERYDVLALGEIVQPRSPGLARISWRNGLLPGSSNGPWVLTGGAFQPPSFYIAFLNRLKAEKQWATLTLDRCLEDGTPYHSDAFPVVVEDFETTEKGGETGDFYYDIELSEYRAYTPDAVTFLPDGETPGAATAVTEPQREVPKGQLVVGARVTVNGPFYYTSYREEPHGNGNGRTAVVGRLITTDPTRPCPILLKTESGGLLGWCDAEAVSQ